MLIPLILTFAGLGFFYAESWQTGLINHLVYGWAIGITSAWTFTEYFFHRFMLHRELNLDPDAEADGKHNAGIFSSHVHHHVFPNQKHRIVLNRPTYKLYVPIGWVVLQLTLPSAVGYPLLAGWLGGSVIYDWMHLAFHFGPDLPFSWFHKMKNAHMRHHYRDNSKEFGVTVPAWDHVFGT